MHDKSDFCPTVSVIVPVKNGAAKIKDLLDSLMQVNYNRDKLEIIVVDGNSTDDTREIVSQYKVKLLTEEGPGLNAARNTGIKYSRGEIIAFTDYDCVVSKNWIEKIVENFQDPHVGCVGGTILGYSNDFFSLYCDESLVPVLRIFKKREVVDTIKPPLNYPAGCNFALKREAIKKVGVFDERIRYGFDEIELIERICGSGCKMVLDPEILVRHKHRSSLSEILKQTFRYGRGGGLLPNIKGIKSKVSRWILLCILGFAVWVSLISSLAYFIFLTGSFALLAALLAILLLPPAWLVTVYTYQTVKRGDKKYGKIVAYPFIDIARAFAFIFGGIYSIIEIFMGKR